MEYAIKVDNLTKKYDLYKTPQDRLRELFSISNRCYHDVHYALKNVSFKVGKGETIGIIGKNGAGKSTLLKILTGVSSATSGSVEINGQVAALLELGTGFNPEFNGYQNIYLNGTMRGLSKEDMDKKISEIINFADIGDYINQPVKTYSSGMFARLAFAVMISFKPEILIVDEALSVGDVFFQQKCNTFMKEEMKGVTKLLVTHDMNSIANMADRVIMLDHGELIQEGQPLDVIQNYLQIMHTETYAKDNGVKQPNDEKLVNTLSDKYWITVNKSDIGGAGDILINSCKLTVNEENINVVKYNDNVTMYMKVYSKKNIKDMIIGYIFKDKYGNSIIGQNSLGSNILVPSVTSGSEYVYKIDIKWPEVKEGDYFVTLGIGEGTNQMVHTIQCWAHNVIHIQAIAHEPMHGIINNKIIGIKQYSI